MSIFKLSDFAAPGAYSMPGSQVRLSGIAGLLDCWPKSIPERQAIANNKRADCMSVVPFKLSVSDNLVDPRTEPSGSRVRRVFRCTFPLDEVNGALKMCNARYGDIRTAALGKYEDRTR
jgi:hypothetical protein